MKRRAILRAVAVLASLHGAACDDSPGRPRPAQIEPAPDDVSNSAILYAKNCSGCHGPDGHDGPSIPLGNSVYLAVADDAAIRHTAANGVPGTPMPAFAKSAGGMLTDQQIDAVVHKIRSWAKPEVEREASWPSHATRAPGQPQRGAAVYAEYCAHCHGSEGRGGAQASSIVEGSYLALVSDQDLRTNVIVGRPEMGAPDFRDDVSGKPMSDQEVTDVVAWLAAQRPRLPGQPYPGQAPDRTLGEIP
jgi:mono/diheme cytochrome c family protein